MQKLFILLAMKFVNLFIIVSPAYKNAVGSPAGLWLIAEGSANVKMSTKCHKEYTNWLPKDVLVQWIKRSFKWGNLKNK